MISRLKNRIKSLHYKHRFPHATVNPTAHIALNSTIGTDTVVGAYSSIISSRIGDHVNVMSSVSISESTLNNDSTIQSNCSISKSVFHSNTVIYAGNSFHDAEIGRFSYFASGSQVSMANYGSFCSVGPYLICGHGDHPTDFVSTSPVFFSTGKQCGVSFSQEDLFEERKKIIVGHDVWVGARVFIRDGIKIGNGVIIAAGSVVVKDVPDYAIVGGVPAKIIRYRFPEDVIKKLIGLAWWNWTENKLRNAQPLFAQNNMYALFEWAKK